MMLILMPITDDEYKEREQEQSRYKLLQQNPVSHENVADWKLVAAFEFLKNASSGL